MRLRTFMITASAAALGFAGAASADDNTLFMQQVGDNNFLPASQSGVDNETYARQTGDFNTGGASTDVAGGNTNKNQALLVQEGNRNIGSWSSETGAQEFARNTIGIVQETNRNFAKLNNQQSRTDSQIFIQQGGGNENYVGSGADVNSTPGNGASNGQTVATSYSGVDQSLINGSSVYPVPTTGSGSGRVQGDGNAVGVSQNGTQNALALNVVGNGNFVGGDGSVGAANLDLFTAGGFYSSAAMVDPSASGIGGVNGLASQDGNNNTGVIAVSGDFNAVSFAQLGDNNVNETYVSGSGNLAIGHQN